MSALARLFALCMLSAITLACKGTRTPVEAPAICALELPASLAHKAPNALPAATWFELMFKGYRDGIPQDAVDCAGEPVAWPETPARCAEGEPREVLISRSQRLSAEQLVVRHAGGDYWFGWAPYARYADGMHEGPLVIARNHDGRLEVRAAGTLRAYPTRARLEVRNFGGQHLLIAEGEHCQGADPCVRGTRLMWLDRQQFRVRPLRSASQRGCLGPAWFPAQERHEVRLDKRWRRTLERDLDLAFGERELVIDEHIRVRDHDVTQPALPARAFRDAEAQLRITLVEGELLSEGQSLWKSIQIEDAATRNELARAEGDRGR